MAGNLQAKNVSSKKVASKVRLQVIYGQTARVPAPLKVLFRNLKEGCITVTLPEGQSVFFGPLDSELKVTWNIFHKDCLNRILREGALGLGESYIEGWWKVENDRLTDFIGILLKNDIVQDLKSSFLCRLKKLLRGWFHMGRFVSDRECCVRKHYDLRDSFFSLWLDKTMAYSCGYRKEGADTLQMMQEQKYELICRKLGLERGGNLLDIGCGWGGLLIYAAQHYDNIMGTGVTLSCKQSEWAGRKIEELGLQDRIQITFSDYQLIEGQYDFISSVGMFEHLGRTGYLPFMNSLAENLNSNGIALLNTTGTLDSPSDSIDPWMDKYMFPGGRMPRLEEITGSLRKAGLNAVHLENLKPHYAETFHKWKEKFDDNRQKIVELDSDFDERFLRIWNYYLQSSEAFFRYGSLQAYQILISKGWPDRLGFNWDFHS